MFQISEVNDNTEDIFYEVSNILKEGQKDVINIDTLVGLMRGRNLTLLGRNDLQENYNYPALRKYNEDIIQETVNLNNKITYENNEIQIENKVEGFVQYYTSIKPDHQIQNFENTKESLARDITFYKKIKNFIDEINNIPEVPFKNNMDMENFKEPSMRTNNDIIRNYLSGNIDLKISSGQVYMMASAGPPYTADKQIKPFQWSKSMFQNIAHLGQIDLFNFDLVQTKWVW